jgi:adenosylcobinamide-GDP ribazoletransferase
MTDDAPDTPFILASLPADFLLALSFLTRIPVPPALSTNGLALAMRAFPLVGGVVGGVGALVFLAASRVWPPLLAAPLAVAATIVTTGALHEDGLADLADGFGGGGDRAAKLAIMKDSRIGSYGALALLVVTSLRIGLLAGLSPWRGAVALVAAHGGARAAAVIVMAALPYAGDPEASKFKPTPTGVRGPEAAFALATGAWPLFGLGAPRAALAIALALATTTAMALTARRLIGGMTGDVLGAVEQLAEVGLLLGAAAGLAGA